MIRCFLTRYWFVSLTLKTIKPVSLFLFYMSNISLIIASIWDFELKWGLVLILASERIIPSYLFNHLQTYCLLMLYLRTVLVTPYFMTYLMRYSLYLIFWVIVCFLYKLLFIGHFIGFTNVYCTIIHNINFLCRENLNKLGILWKMLFLQN